MTRHGTGFDGAGAVRQRWFMAPSTSTTSTVEATPATHDQVHFRTCHLCEATCGLEITTRGNDVVRIRGDRSDVFSKGFICPKGSTIKDLDRDPDRVRQPMIRTGATWREVSWEEAFMEIDARWREFQATQPDPRATAVYFGNPTAHNISSSLYLRSIINGLKTTNVFSASTVDQMPKQISAALMFGTMATIPVPDLDRTDFLVMLGANPWESNGSLCTAPDFPGRVDAIRERGGTVVVVDPRRTKTAEHADRHLAIIPGTDAALLAAIVHVLFAEELFTLGAAEGRVAGLDAVRTATIHITPAWAAPITGLEADDITSLARDLAAAPTAAVYGRIGTCINEFGTLTSWLVDVVNVLTGNLDRAGGAMFSTTATQVAPSADSSHASPRKAKAFTLARWTSRVRGAAEAGSELPVAVLAEEIETPGDGQIRALFSVAGNPVLSTPDGRRLDNALASLEFYVAIDSYLNETTRHAHVLLPAPRSLTRPHYDHLLYQFAVRSVANWSDAVFELDADERHEWDTLLRLGAIVAGTGVDVDVDALDDDVARARLASAVRSSSGVVAGRDVDELLELCRPERGPARLIDISLRLGRFGDGFGARPGGLSLAELRRHPHGMDFGPLVPRLDEALATPSGSIELAPAVMTDDLVRFTETHQTQEIPGDVPGASLHLIGRRDLRSNNSWMHNVNVLVKGSPRCTLQIHPDDALAREITDGALVRITSSVGSIDVHAAVSPIVRRGVVSLPHGYGHHRDGARLDIARAHAGESFNDLVDTKVIDPHSGNAALNSTRVRVQPVATA
jgi:anaerobic selenocysteine-containing dehydrogenase